jgi:hypothetical protein
MAETASTIPPSGIGTLHISDFLKSLLLAALTNVLLGVYTIIQSGSFPTHADWVTMLKSTVAIVISYLLKNLGTNNTGQILKKDQPVVTVPADKLNEVIKEADSKP